VLISNIGGRSSTQDETQCCFMQFTQLKTLDLVLFHFHLLFACRYLAKVNGRKEVMNEGAGEFILV